MLALAVINITVLLLMFSGMLAICYMRRYLFCRRLWTAVALLIGVWIVLFGLLGWSVVSHLELQIILTLLLPFAYYAGNSLWENRKISGGTPDFILCLFLCFLTFAISIILMTTVPWTPNNAMPAVSGRLAICGVIILGVLSAISEEVALRHYLQGKILQLVKTPYLAAILSVLIPTLLFVAMHHGMVDPPWLKSTQIALLGISLGITRLRTGILSTIALHLAYNLMMLYLNIK